MSYSHRYPTTCPECGADLTARRSVELRVIINGREHEAGLTNLDADGTTVDIDGLIAGGNHSDCMCYRCGESLSSHEILEENAA